MDNPNEPFSEVLAKASVLINDGWMLFQKWTCRACGDRIAMDVANTFYATGQHEDCKVDPQLVTDIEADGMGFVAVADVKDRGYLRHFETFGG